MRASYMLAPALEERLDQILRPEERERLIYWRKRSRSKRSMLPYPFRSGEITVTDAEYRRNNTRFGNWVSWYTGREVDLIGPSVVPGQVCIQYGIGDRALGLDYLRKVVFWKLQPLLVDWLAGATWLAKQKITKILAIDPVMFDLDSVVKLAEIKRTLCTDNTDIVESPRLIRLSQIARVIEHQEEDDAAEMCYGTGRPLADPNNLTVVIGAMKGPKNSGIRKETSHNYSVPFHLYHIGRGAGRPVKVVRQDTFEDLANRFKALTIRAV